MFVVHVHDSFSEGMFRMFVQGFLHISGMISGMLHEQLRGQCSEVSVCCLSLCDVEYSGLKF